MAFFPLSRSLFVYILILAAFLSGCAEAPVEDTRPVKMAKACQRAKENNPSAIPGFTIKACTNNGIWMIEELAADGQVLKVFDFVNQEYSGPESSGNFIPVADMGIEAPVKFQAIRKTLNEKLLNPES